MFKCIAASHIVMRELLIVLCKFHWVLSYVSLFENRVTGCIFLPKPTTLYCIVLYILVYFSSHECSIRNFKSFLHTIFLDTINMNWGCHFASSLRVLIHDTHFMNPELDFIKLFGTCKMTNTRRFYNITFTLLNRESV